MAVKIRLTRTGAGNDVCYRVVATDGRSPRDGRFLENLGWYDPKRAIDNFSIKIDRIEHWQSQGAQTSDTVKSLVRRAKRMAAAAPAVEPAPVPVVEPAAVADESASAD
jgi:small subunit ribosomal protein S16